MASLIVDLDGTAMYWGTNTFVPGAYERLKKFHNEGNELIFTTQRGRITKAFIPSEQLLKNLFPGCVVLYDISSPRIVINDAGTLGINHPRDAGWNYDFNDIVERAKNE